MMKEEIGRCPSGRSGGPSDLSRCASQPPAPAANAERAAVIGKFASGRMDDGTPAAFTIEELCGDKGFIGRCVSGSGFVAKPGYIPWANVTVHATKDGALAAIAKAEGR